jgi:preprotein translocase subunit SecG
LTFSETEGIIRKPGEWLLVKKVSLPGVVLSIWRLAVVVFFNIALIITSIALIASVIVQSKGAGLGGLTGADTGGIFTARRGIEKILFWVTVVLSVLFFTLTIATYLVNI